MNSEPNQDPFKVRSYDPIDRAKEDIRSAIKEVESAMDEINKGNRRHRGKLVDPLSERGKFELQNLSVCYKDLKQCLTWLSIIN